MRRVVCAAIAMLAVSSVRGQTSNELEPLEDYNKKIQSAQMVSPLSGDIFGEKVNLYDGSTSFHATDISLPGNNGLSVSLSRYFKVMNRRQELTLPGLADWEIDTPRLYGEFSPPKGWKTRSASPYSRCSIPAVADAAAIINGTEYPSTTHDIWHGYHMHLPGKGGQELLVDNQAKLPAIQDGQTYPWVTADFTRFRCLPSTRNGYPGEGFLAVTADGIKYHFDHAVSHSIRGYKIKMGTSYQYVGRSRVYLMASRVEDRFGNWVNYNYTGDLLTSIQASDGRLISLSYVDGRLSGATAHGRTWSYQYEWSQAYPVPAGAYRLRSVTSPDASVWDYRIVAGSLLPQREQPPDGGQNNNCRREPDRMDGSFSMEVTTPSRASGLFEFHHARMYRRHTPRHFCDTPRTEPVLSPYIPHYFDVYTLRKKTINGPGINSQAWAYAVSSAGYQFYTSGTANDPCPTCIPSKSVTVTAPDGTRTVHEYGVMYGLNEGRLLSTQRQNAAGTALSASATTYLQDSDAASQAFPAEVGGTLLHLPNALSNRLRPVTSTALTQDGVTYNRSVPATCNGTYCFDAFARSLRTLGSNSATPAQALEEVTSFHDDAYRWVLGQQARKTINGILVSETGYNGLAQPVTFTQFGRLRQTLTYGADGTIATVKDGNNNVTTASNWKRGIPQSIKYPVAPESPSGATKSAVVSDSGWITSVTDENGYTTGYGYDAMGRLASIVYPTGDTTAWNTTTQVFQQMVVAEYGIPAGHWRQTVSTGNARKITYFDALWRPLVTKELDATNATTETLTKRFQRFIYDHEGRVTFASYPGATDTLTTGIWTEYDALGRTRTVSQDSEHGLLTTTTSYLNNSSGPYTLVTTPAGQQTRTWFQMFDQPDYSRPVTIWHPEVARTHVTRDVFGKPTRIRRSNSNTATGGTLAINRDYTYNAYQELCRSVEPETGATLMGYDGAGNLKWSAAGLPASQACEAAGISAPVAARRTDRTYDARNRLKTLIFPDGRGNQSWTYWPDGLPQTITTNNISGGDQVINRYYYNKRRLMRVEQSEQPGWYNWQLETVFDGNASVAKQRYPTGLDISFSPNALGQATEARDQSTYAYASGASYYPNGALKQFTYGNGLTHTMTQNARQLPDRVTGSGLAMDFSYRYDANGNVNQIYDHVPDMIPGSAPKYRLMEYDGLDRLTAAGSAMFGGNHWHRFTYDALDNMKSWKLAGVKDYAEYVYDAQNRLGNIKNSGGATVVGFGYDSQGNLQNKNGQMYSFDYGNRLREVTGKEYFRYDGQGRRVLAWSPATGGILSVYSLAGQVLYQQDDRRAIASENIYFAGSVIALRERAYSGSTYNVKYQHTDALGSPVAVTNQTGAVIERSDYEPYGAVIGKPNYQGIGYTGHVQDAATGLTYMQQRYYDPLIGRFLSVDPVTAMSDPTRFFNRYKYASNNPYKFIDPDGRADVNYFYGGNFFGGGADSLYDAAERFDIPGMTTVMGHSWATGYRDDRGFKIGPPVEYSSLKNDIAAVRGPGRDQGYIFLGGCNLGYRGVPARLAKDFNTNVLSSPGYVRRSESANGDISYTANSQADGKGSARWFQMTKPDGTASGRLGSVTMHADGKVTFRAAEAPTGTRIRPTETVDPER